MASIWLGARDRIGETFLAFAEKLDDESAY
jgi:hypothetical protein